MCCYNTILFGTKLTITGTMLCVCVGGSFRGILRKGNGTLEGMSPSAGRPCRIAAAHSPLCHPCLPTAVCPGEVTGDFDWEFTGGFSLALWHLVEEVVRE